MRKRTTLAPLLFVACSGTEMATGVTPDAALAQTRPPGVALCYTPAADTHPATIAFRSALSTGDRSKRAAAIDALDAATEDLPQEEQLHLFLGLAHLWRLAEPLPGEDSGTTQLGSAIGARDHLKKAKELCPTDARIAAWLGPIQVQMGRKLNDQNTINEGLAILDEGIAAYPSFVLFSKLLVYADSPRTSPEFQQALAAVLANIDACNTTPGDPACTNLTVPHNSEGAMLFLGDVVSKGGLRDKAQAAYTDAMMGAGWSAYPYKDTIVERLQNLDARIMAYESGSDPASAWTAPNQCALCHTN
jgi:hypothetical protein